MIKKKWLDQKASPEFLDLVCLVLIIVFIYLLIRSVANFWRGMHNIDLYTNFLSVSEQMCKNNNLSITLNDTANDFNTRPISDYYIIGMNQIEYSFMNGLVCIGTLGILIGIIIGGKLWKR